MPVLAFLLLLAPAPKDAAPPRVAGLYDVTWGRWHGTARIEADGTWYYKDNSGPESGGEWSVGKDGTFWWVEPHRTWGMAIDWSTGKGRGWIQRGDRRDDETAVEMRWKPEPVE